MSQPHAAGRVSGSLANDPRRPAVPVRQLRGHRRGGGARRCHDQGDANNSTPSCRRLENVTPAQELRLGMSIILGSDDLWRAECCCYWLSSFAVGEGFRSVFSIVFTSVIALILLINFVSGLIQLLGHPRRFFRWRCSAGFWRCARSRLQSWWRRCSLPGPRRCRRCTTGVLLDDAASTGGRVRASGAGYGYGQNYPPPPPASGIMPPFRRRRRDRIIHRPPNDAV